MSKHEHTHESEKDADEPSLEVTVEAVWRTAVRDIVEGGHCDYIAKHDVSSEHRDESKLTEVPEHHDESKFRKVIANIEADQNSEWWSRKWRWMNRIQVEDRNQDVSEFGQNEVTDETLQQEVLREFVMNLLLDRKIKTRKVERIRELGEGSKIGAGEHARIHGEVSDGSKVATR